MVELSPESIAVIAGIVSGIFMLVHIRGLPRNLRQTFSPAVYIMPIMTVWGTYVLLTWAYSISPVIFYGFVTLIPLTLVGIFMFRLIVSVRQWLQRRHWDPFGQINVPVNPPPPPPPNKIAFIERLPITQFQPQVDFDNAPIIQYSQQGQAVWQPTPVLNLRGNVPLTADWVSIDIKIPERVRQGEKLAIRVDVSNNHASRVLRDQALLEVRFPTGVAQALGPDPINIEPSGDMVSLFYTWNVPYLAGNYVIRYHLLNLSSKTEKALAVQ